MTLAPKSAPDFRRECALTHSIAFGKNAQPAPERCRSERVWDFPTSILQRKICICAHECTACWIRCSFSGSMLAVASSKYFLRQQERNLLQGSALIAAVTQVMKMKEIYLSKLPMDCYGDGEPQQTHQTGFGRSKKDLGEMHCHRLMATPRITNRTDRQMQLTPFLRSVKASKEH